jgi:hypothetical protein
MNHCRTTILNIIARHSTLGAEVKDGHIMYVHGSEEEFEDMIRDIEEELDCVLVPSQDIGEMTVEKFVDWVLASMP